MPWTIKTPPDVPYVEVFVSGDLSKEDIYAAYLETIAAARAAERDILLADFRSLRGGHEIGDVYDLSAARLKHEKIRFSKEALVLPTKPSAAELVRFWESTSVNRGFNVQSFAGRQRAIDWLLGDGR